MVRSKMANADALLVEKNPHFGCEVDVIFQSRISGDTDRNSPRQTKNCDLIHKSHRDSIWSRFDV